MFEHKCYCQLCGVDATHTSRKAVLSEKEKKGLDFICNDCMWKILQKEWQAKPAQLGLFKI